MRYCEICRAAFQGLTRCPKDGINTRADLDDPLVGHVLGDRFRILEPIAAGGMGQVYRAAHTRIASLYAVKVLYGDYAYDAQMRTRFQREAEAAACLQSRHIVRVVDFSESSEGLLYLAMEHLKGGSLASAITQGAMPEERAIGIGIQIARGLSHAHERGIVHRDLKPGNVMLIREDDEPDVVRLLDFGIARLSEATGLTQAGAVMGTPAYMAPEQFRGSVDARADLYALGIILYEMLTGDIPFACDSLMGYARMHMYEPPPSFVERKLEGARPELEAVVRRLLEKSPDARFASAREVIVALKAVPTAARASIAPASAFAPEPIAGTAAAERIHAALNVGAPMYNAGDHAGCAAMYQKTAEALLAGGLRIDTVNASAARLEVGLARAKVAPDATRAAWELRWMLDDVLLVVRAPPSAGLVFELAAAATIAAPRYAAGELDLVAAYYKRFAERILAVAGTSGHRAVVATLTDAFARARSEGDATPAILAHIGRALDVLREGARSSPAPISLTPSMRLSCPGLDAIASRVSQAIGAGAPAYNSGDRDGCYRIYRETAEEIITSVRGRPGCAALATLLREAIDRAAPMPASQAAWTLRHAFDEVLAQAQRAN